jgi:hypothetical protein
MRCDGGSKVSGLGAQCHHQLESEQYVRLYAQRTSRLLLVTMLGRREPFPGRVYSFCIWQVQFLALQGRRAGEPGVSDAQGRRICRASSRGASLAAFLLTSGTEQKQLSGTSLGYVPISACVSMQDDSVFALFGWGSFDVIGTTAWWWQSGHWVKVWIIMRYSGI